jgi:hypothetical protein
MERALRATIRDAEARAVYGTLLEAEILPMDPESWDKVEGNRARLRNQSLTLCRRLWEAGLDMPARGQGSIVAVGMASGEVQPFDEPLRSNLIPTVARRHRAPMLRHVRAWMALHPRPKAIRYAVWTYGPRVTARELPEAIRRLTRRISQAPHDDRMREVHYAPHYRGVELGTPQFDGREWTYHLHANVIFSADYMQADRWEEFIASDLRRLNDGFLIKEAGAIQKPEEVVKYISKPEDLLALPPGELLSLHWALKRRRLHSPLGELRRIIRRCDEEMLRPVQVRGRWRYLPDWNRTRQRIARAPSDADVADQIEGRYVAPGWRTGKLEDTSPEVSRVLSVSLPCAFSDPWPEPVAIIWATSPGARQAALDRLRARPAIQAWLERAAEARELHRQGAQTLDGLGLGRGRGLAAAPSGGAAPSGAESGPAQRSVSVHTMQLIAGARPQGEAREGTADRPWPPDCRPAGPKGPLGVGNTIGHQ